MARNQEKAMSMLNRWVRMKQELDKNPEQDRPSDPQVCKNVKSCIFWREDLINEIMRKVTEIQNAALGEHRIRELNDQINDFLQEKRDWEDRIMDLGGPDFRAQEADLIDSEATELPGVDDYKYFGAAKDLPGVREKKLQRTVPTLPKRNYKYLQEQIHIDYFGQENVNEELEAIEREWEERQLENYDPEVRVLPFLSEAFEESRLFKSGEEATAAGVQEEDEDQFMYDVFRATRNTEEPEEEKPEDLIDLDEVQKLINAKKKELLEKDYAAVEAPAEEKVVALDE